MKRRTTAVVGGHGQTVASGCPARPVGYRECVTRIVDQAPILTDDQRARIRGAFFQPVAGEAA